MATAQTDLNIIARLVDEVSGPLAKLRANIQALGTAKVGDVGELAKLRVQSEDAAKAIEEIAVKAAPALAVVQQSAQRVEQELATITTAATTAAAAQAEADRLLADLEQTSVGRLQRERAEAAASVETIKARVDALKLEGAQVDKLKEAAARFQQDLTLRVDTRAAQEALELEARTEQIRTTVLSRERELARLRGQTANVAKLDAAIADQAARALDAAANRQIAALREQYRGRADLNALLDEATKKLREQVELDKRIVRATSSTATGRGANIQAAGAGLSQAAQGLSIFGANGAARIAQTGSALSSISTELSGIGAAATGAGIALGAAAAGVIAVGAASAGLVAAARSAASFDEEFSRLPGVIKLSREEAKELRAQIFDLSRTFDLDATATANAYFTAFAEGARNAAEATELVVAASKLEAAGLATQQQAIQAVSDAYDTFGASIGSATEVTAKLNATALAAGLPLQVVANNIGALGRSAKLINADFEETLGLFAQLKNDGAKPRQAVSEIDAAFRALADPSVRQALARNGVIISDYSIQSKGATSALREIGKVIGTNRDALAAVSPELARAQGAIRTVTGSAQKLAETTASIQVGKDIDLSRLQESFKVIEGAANSLKSVLVEVFGPIVLDSLATMIRSLRENEGLVRAVATAIAVAAVATKLWFDYLELVVEKLKFLNPAYYAGSLIQKLLPDGSKETIKGVAGAAGEAKTIFDQFTEAFNTAQRALSQPKTSPALKETVEKVRELREIAAIDINGLLRVGDLDQAQKRADELLATFNELRKTSILPSDIEQTQADVLVSAVKRSVANARSYLSGEIKQLITDGDFEKATAAAARFGKTLEGLIGRVTVDPEANRAFVEATELLNEAILAAGNPIVQIGTDISQVMAAAGKDVNSLSINVTRLQGVLGQTPASIFAQTDIQRELDRVFATLTKEVPPPLKIPLEIEPDQAVNDALATVRRLSQEATQDGIVKIELLEPNKKAEFDRALEVVRRFAASLKEVSAIKGDVSLSLKNVKLDDADIRRTFDALRTRIEASVVPVEVKARLTLEANQAEADALKAAGLARVQAEVEKWRNVTREIAQQRVRVTQASIQAAREVREILSGFGADISRQAVSAQDSIRQAVAKASDDLVASFLRAPSFNPGPVLRALAEVQEAGRQAIARAGLQSFQDDLIELRSAQIGLFDPFSNSLAQVQLELDRTRVGIERMLEASPEKTDLAQQLKEAAEKRADAERGRIAVEFALRPKIEFDQLLVQAEIARKLKPDIDELAEGVRILLSGDPLPDGLAKRIDELREKVRALQRQADETAERFRLGFGEGLQQAIDDLNNKYRQGFTLAQDAVSALTDNFADFIYKLGQGKASFKDFANSVLQDIQRILSRNLAENLLGNLLGFFTGGANVLGGLAPASASAAVVPGLGSTFYGTGFERGGVMAGQMLSPRGIEAYGAFTRSFEKGGIMPGGMMPVRAYASGGVATSPQMAIFAERPGMAEAFVPLPGVGRGIPVEFPRGAPGGGGNTVHVSIHMSAIDSRSGAEFLQQHAREIGDLVQGQISSGSNNRLRRSVGGQR
jgi:hypothetical protein